MAVATTLRLRTSRHGKVRFVSHRDMARIIERALRVHRLPIAYSEGFSPRPRISFGLALSVAYESEAEYLDVDLVTPIDLEGLAGRLTETLPDGIAVEAVIEVEPRSTSLQQLIECCSWHIEILDESLPDVTTAVAALVAAPERLLERERKGKRSTVDVRPGVLAVEVLGPTDRGVQVSAVLATSDVTVRPSELVQLLGSDWREGRVCRTHQWTRIEGEWCEPVPLPGRTATPPAVAPVRPDPAPDDEGRTRTEDTHDGVRSPGSGGRRPDAPEQRRPGPPGSEDPTTSTEGRRHPAGV